MNNIITKLREISLNGYINYLFVLYAFLVPLSRGGITILTALLFVLWLFTDNLKDKINFLKSNKIIIYLVAFVVFSLLSLLWSDNIPSGLYYVRKYWYFLPILVIATTIEIKFIYYGVSAFLFGMLSSEIISYGIFFELWTTRHSSPSDPTPFMSHVQYSMFLALTSLIILNRLFKENVLKWKILYFLYFLTTTSNLFLNGGRTGQLAFVMSIFVVGILNIKHRLLALFSMSVLVTAILITAYNISPVFKSKVHISIAETKNILDSNYTGSLGQRISMWTIGNEIFLDNPIAGIGVSCKMNTFNEYIDKNHYNEMNEIKKMNSYHSNYTQALVQLGVIGFALYMMFIYSLLTLNIKNREYFNMLIIFVIVYSISSTFETMFHSQFGEALLALFVGIFIAESRQTYEIKGIYKELLVNVKNYFNNSNNSIHKARNEIKCIEFNNETLAIKSFGIPHIINKIAYTLFKESKAEKSYNNSIRIIDFVPKPIAFLEFKKFGFISNSYFISENFEYDFTIREPLLEDNFKDKESVFKEFANFTKELHDNDIVHLDYSPGNILIKKSDSGYIYKIVDINRMKFKPLSLDDRLKNFSKLWAKDDDLIIIIKEYAKLIKADKKYCITKALKYSQAHKDRKNMKKRLKGIEVVD